MTEANDPRVANVSIISAGLEYAYHFSGHTKRIELLSRGAHDFHLAFDPNQSVSGKYRTVKAAVGYSVQGTNTSPRFYFSGTAGDTIEIVYWL